MAPVTEKQFTEALDALLAERDEFGCIDGDSPHAVILHIYIFQEFVREEVTDFSANDIVDRLQMMMTERTMEIMSQQGKIRCIGFSPEGEAEWELTEPNTE